MKEYFFEMEDIKIPIYLMDTMEEIECSITKHECNKVLLLYDDNVDNELVSELEKKINKKIVCAKIGVHIDEKTKNLQTVSDLIDSILEHKANRGTILVAIGGGVVGNVVGMVAGLAFRGLVLIHIPTTIVAATDSILSIKQAVNTQYGKNLAGVYYRPDSVLISNDFFKSLPKREYNAGLAETVKNLLAIIPEEIPTFKEKIKKLTYRAEDLRYIFDISFLAKQKVLLNDKFEKQSGIVLEYGHTIGHAIEVVTEGKVRHGEAIAFGMLVAAEISNEFGFLSDDELQIHYELLSMINVYEKLYLLKECYADKIIDIMRYDNKRTKIDNNKISIVVLKRLGECYSNGYYDLLEVDSKIVIDKINSVKIKLNDYLRDTNKAD